MKIIETERLYLRELLIDDKKDLMKVLSNPESMKFYPYPFSEEDVERWIQWNIVIRDLQRKLLLPVRNMHLKFCIIMNIFIYHSTKYSITKSC